MSNNKAHPSIAKTQSLSKGSLSRGSLSGRCLCLEGLCPGSFCPGGSLSRGISVRGFSVWGVSLSRETPLRYRAGGTHPAGMHSCNENIFKHTLNLKCQISFKHHLQQAAPVTDGIGSTTRRIHTQTGSRINRPKMNTVPWLHWTQKTVSGGFKVVLLDMVWPVNHQKVSCLIK